MTNLKVLVEGIHKEINGVMNASSTVTLIRSEGKNIIVDTGTYGESEKLVEELKKEGLKPEDIDYVILTHTHLDHASNSYLFSNSEIYTKHSPQSTGAKFYGNSKKIKIIDIDNYEFTKEVKTILTKGHLEAHISVIVKTDEGICVVCGDAIQEEHQADLNHKPRKVWNRDEYEKSRKKILEIADYIIPGHGKKIKVK